MSLDTDNRRKVYPPDLADHKSAKLTHPSKMQLNLRKLQLDTCKRYLDFHGLRLRPGSIPSEYSAAVAKHVNDQRNLKFGVLHRFCSAIQRRVYARNHPATRDLTPQDVRELQSIRVKRKLHSIMNFETESQDPESSEDEAVHTAEPGVRESGGLQSDKQTDKAPPKRNRIS